MSNTKEVKRKPAKTNYPVHELIANRWSPRMFSNEDITDDEMMSLFEAARWAPSSNNFQPWRFIYARKGTALYKQLFDYLAPFNQGWVKHAPILVYTAIKLKTPKGLDNFHANHDLGLAVGNMSLQAESMGIALHQMAGFDHQQADKDFGIDGTFHFVTAIAIGRYGGDVNDLKEDLQGMEIGERTRKSLEEIVSNQGWSDQFNQD